MYVGLQTVVGVVLRRVVDELTAGQIYEAVFTQERWSERDMLAPYAVDRFFSLINQRRFYL